jgi:Hemagglutinin repeat
VTVSASVARGHGNGQSTTWSNTRIDAASVTLDSGGDTTLKGAVVAANSIKADIGGALRIESLQDTASYTEKQTSAGASVTVGAGASGSANFSQSRINSVYASVAEQSGLKAGDGGFQVTVRGNTNLVGGAITSTQAAIDSGVNSFSTAQLTTSDIDNKASYSARSISVSAGSGGGSAGFSNESSSASSTTRAAISGVAGNQSARTGDKDSGLANTFDRDAVRAEMQANTAITQEFGRQAPKAVGDYATGKLRQAVELKAAALEQTDPVKRAEMVAEANALEANWKEGGPARTSMHVFTAALSQGMDGALGAAFASTALPAISEQMDKAGLSPVAKNALIQLTFVGLATQNAGAGVAGLDVNANNRALHEKETALLKAKSQEFSEQLKAKGYDLSPEQAQAILKEQAENRIDSSSARTPDHATGNDGIKAEAAKFLNQVAKDAGTFSDDSGKTTRYFTNRDAAGNLRIEDFNDPKLYADIKAAEHGKFTGTLSLAGYAVVGGGGELEFKNGELVNVKLEAGLGLGGHVNAAGMWAKENPAGPGAKWDLVSYASSGQQQPGEGRIGVNMSGAARLGPAQLEGTLVNAGLQSTAGGSSGAYYDVAKVSASVVPSLSVGAEGKVVVEWSYSPRKDKQDEPPKGK